MAPMTKAKKPVFSEEALEYFRQQGLKGGRKLKREKGPAYYKRIGKLGGRPPKKSRRKHE